MAGTSYHTESLDLIVDVSGFNDFLNFNIIFHLLICKSERERVLKINCNCILFYLFIYVCMYVFIYLNQTTVGIHFSSFVFRLSAQNKLPRCVLDDWLLTFVCFTIFRNYTLNVIPIKRRCPSGCVTEDCTAMPLLTSNVSNRYDHKPHQT